MDSPTNDLYCSACRLLAAQCQCAMLSSHSATYRADDVPPRSINILSSHFGHPMPHHPGGFYHPSSPSPSSWQYPANLTASHPYPSYQPSNSAPAAPHPPPTTIQFSNVFASSYNPNQPPPPSTPGPSSSRTSKRSAGPTSSNPPPKRRCVSSIADKENVPPPQLPQQIPSAVPGIGPATQEIPPEFDPTSTYGSALKKEKHNSTAATDVWWFMVALPKYTQGEEPETSPENMETYLMKRPSEKDYEGLGCRLCRKPAQMHAWKNTDGMTATIRAHLIKEHGPVWREFVLLNHLKDWDKVDLAKEKSKGEGYTISDFTLTGFYERLVRWIIADDQSINVVDCPELRDLLLYVGTQLEPSQIPHRTRLTSLILQRFGEMCDAIRDEMKGASGRVSLTSDMWTNKSQESFMAVTAHYIIEDDGRLQLKARLIAFKRIEGAHDGDNLGDALMSIIKEWGILNKLGFITLDNASNCNTMMRRVERLLRRLDIEFEVEENRIRCFPHVVNLCVKAGLRCLAQVGPEKLSDFIQDSDSFIADLQDDLATNTGYDISDDVVALARKLANALRSSGQRLDDLSAVIRKGWEDKLWTPDDVPDHTVLNDMDVRWSSTFLMIDRILELYPAIEVMAEMNKHAWLQGYLLTAEQLRLLDKIRNFLEIPHAIQEGVSADKTPTLPVALPAYEQLLAVLKAFKAAEPEIAHGVQAAIDKLEEYFGKTRSARVYEIAMIVNPTIKMEWLKANWSPTEVESAKETMITAMARYQRVLRESNPSPAAAPSNPGLRSIPRPTGSRAARKQRNVMATIGDLCRTYSNSSVASETPSALEGDMPNTEDMSPDALLAADRRVAEAAFNRYCDEGVICDEKDLRDFDILRWWEKHRRAHELVFRVALDVLPAQASAVPCERVFSSAKETDTLRRNGLTPILMEALQISKYALKSERLDFRDDWVAREEDPMIKMVDVNPEILHTMLNNRELDKLHNLIENAYKATPLVYS